MKFARIENGVVRETVPFDPAGRYHSSLVWVECPETTEVGHLCDGDVFSVPPPPAPTAEELAAQVAAAKYVEDAAEARQYAKLTALKGMSPAQISSWVDANVTNLASAQDAIKTLAIAVSILARRL